MVRSVSDRFGDIHCSAIAGVPGLELVFGPLDRIYVLHKWLGIIAMVGLGLHDIGHRQR